MSGGIFKEEIKRKEEEIKFLKYRIDVLDEGLKSREKLIFDYTCQLKESKEDEKELKLRIAGLEVDNTEYRKAVSKISDEFQAFKQNSYAEGEEERRSSEAHKRCEELQKELNRWRKLSVPTVTRTNVDGKIGEHWVTMAASSPESVKRVVEKANENYLDSERKVQGLEKQLKETQNSLGLLCCELESSRFAKEAKNVQAMQSKIDRLKKGNQDLQAKLEESERRESELRGENGKYHIHNSSLFLMNEDLRGAVAFHKEGNYEKIKNLEKENERLKKDMWALLQDSENFLKCNAEKSHDIEFLEKWVLEFFKVVSNLNPYLININHLPERIIRIIIGENKCS